MCESTTTIPLRSGVSWFMAALAREAENASESRQRKREAEEADKVEVTPGVSKLETF